MGTNMAREAQVISIDHNCLSCAPSIQNELTVKAFKMACLQYEPSKVFFENSNYQRNELLEAKDVLLKYCLSQLRHLDLGVIDQLSHISKLDQVWSTMQQNQEDEGVDYGSLNPKNYPKF